MNTKNKKDDAENLDVLRKIGSNPQSSQRQLAKELGFSLGKLNYCLNALIEIGFVKVKNFNNSTKKIKYVYTLTPKGIKQKAVITNQFIIKKKQEYDKLMLYFKS